MQKFKNIPNDNRYKSGTYQHGRPASFSDANAPSPLLYHPSFSQLSYVWYKHNPMVYAIALDETTAATLKIKLFRNVKNVPELRRKAINGALKCCLVKPNLIVDPFQITVATNKALTAEKLKTKSVYTEILYNLSVSKNITQSLQTFGIGDDETDVLVLVVCKDGQSAKFNDVCGDETDINVLEDLADVALIKKIYKIDDVEFEEIGLLDSIVSRIAVKDCLL